MYGRPNRSTILVTLLLYYLLWWFFLQIILRYFFDSLTCFYSHYHYAHNLSFHPSISLIVFLLEILINIHINTFYSYPCSLCIRYARRRVPSLHSTFNTINCQTCSRSKPMRTSNRGETVVRMFVQYVLLRASCRTCSQS